MNRAQLTAAKHAARHSGIAHLLRTTCPYCHAPAGEPCRSKSGTPIWTIGQMHDARLTLRTNDPANYYVERDANKQQLACVYFENGPGAGSAGNLLTKDEARRIAANIANCRCFLLAKGTIFLVESARGAGFSAGIGF